jgi:hypothetical protein
VSDLQLGDEQGAACRRNTAAEDEADPRELIASGLPRST